MVHEVDYVHKPFFEFQEFAEGLSARGHQVSVLHVQEFEKKAGRKLESVIEIAGLQVPESRVKLYSPKFVVRGIFSRILVIFAQARILLRIFAVERPDLVLSFSVPTSGVTVAVLGRLFRVPVVHRAIDVSHLLRAKMLAPIIRMSEILTFTLSTAVSTHNSALQSYVKKTTGEGKQISIENPPVYPIDVPAKSKLMKRRKDLRLIFIGTLAHFTDLENVLYSMSSMESDLRISLRIVGSGPKEQDLRKISKSMGLDERVEFRGWKERNDFADEILWADIGIVPFRKNLLTDCALPHKAIEYLSYGLPVVSARLKGAESVLREIEGMHFVDSSDEIIGQCVNLSRDRKLKSVDQDFVNAHFSREAAVKSMENMLIQVAMGSGK